MGNSSNGASKGQIYGAMWAMEWKLSLIKRVMIAIPKRDSAI